MTRKHKGYVIKVREGMYSDGCSRVLTPRELFSEF